MTRILSVQELEEMAESGVIDRSLVDEFRDIEQQEEPEEPDRMVELLERAVTVLSKLLSQRPEKKPSVIAPPDVKINVEAPNVTVRPTFQPELNVVMPEREWGAIILTVTKRDGAGDIKEIRITKENVAGATNGERTKTAGE